MSLGFSLPATHSARFASKKLIDTAIKFGCQVLKPGGAMVAKLFMGAEFKEVIA